MNPKTDFERKITDIERGPITGRGFQLMPHMRSLGRGIYVHDTADVEEPECLGDGCVIWAMAYVMRTARVGSRCMLGQSVHVGSEVVIGNGCSLQNGAQIFTGAVLEDDVFLGPHVVFTNVLTPRAFQRAPVLKRTLVKRGVSIGANATIVCGITIGEYAQIGAGTVVTKDVPPYTRVIGVPARPRCYICRCGHELTPDVGTEWSGVRRTNHWTCLDSKHGRGCGALYDRDPKHDGPRPFEGRVGP